MTLDVVSWLPCQLVDSHRAGSSAADTKLRIWTQAVHSGAAPRRVCTGIQETGWDKGRVKRGCVCVQFQMKSSHSLMSTGNVEAPSVPCLLSVNGLSYSPVCHCLKETLGELQTVHWCEAALGSQEKSLKVGAENLRSIMWKNARVSGHSFLGLSWWNLLPAHQAQRLLVWTSPSTFFQSLLVLDPAVPPDSGLQTSVSWEWFPVCFLGQIPGTTQGCRYTVAFSHPDLRLAPPISRQQEKRLFIVKGKF